MEKINDVQASPTSIHIVGHINITSNTNINMRRCWNWQMRDDRAGACYRRLATAPAASHMMTATQSFDDVGSAGRHGPESVEQMAKNRNDEEPGGSRYEQLTCQREGRRRFLGYVRWVEPA